MYLLRRKADGKYWRNRGYHSYSRWNKVATEAEWVEDVVLCSPFPSKTGAFSSRGISVLCPVPYPQRGATNEEWSINARQRTAWHSNVRPQLIRDTYEVVPVTILITSGDPT